MTPPPRSEELGTPHIARRLWNSKASPPSDDDDELDEAGRTFAQRDGSVFQHAPFQPSLQLDKSYERQPSMGTVKPSSVYDSGTTASVSTTATAVTSSSTEISSSLTSSCLSRQSPNVARIPTGSDIPGPHRDINTVRKGSGESQKPHYDSSELRRNLQQLLYRHNSSVEARLKSEVRRRLDRSCQETPLLILSGSLASGKTHLAASIRHLVEGELKGYFVTGRFDPVQGPAPYPAYVAALQDFRDQVLERGPQEVMRVRKSVNSVEGLDPSLLTRFFSGLKDILGNGSGSMEGMPSSRPDAEPSATNAPGPPAPASSGAILRFMYVFGSFFRAISSPDRPLVLLIDDLHFGDPGSINVLATGVINETYPGFLVIGTVEAEIVSPDSHLASKLREIEDQGNELVHLSINNLDETELVQCLEGFFHWTDPDDARALSSLLHRHTLGDAFFMTELLCWFYEEKALSLDFASQFWSWDSQRVHDLLASCPSLDLLLSEKISTLPDETVQLLQVASCLGQVIDDALIEDALGLAIQDALEHALSRGGLITYDTIGNRKRYRFLNEHIRRVANQLIPEGDRLKFHLELGRRLWRRLDELSMEERVFQVLNLLRVGQDLIQKQKERRAVASMCLHAGAMAARSSAFLVARDYLAMGITLLGSHRWRDDYELALALHNASAEMGICSGNLDDMETHIKSVMANARQFPDTMHARMAKLYSYGMQAGRYYEAFREGVKLLRKLGVKLPSKYSRARLMWELLSVRRLVSGKSDQFFMRMPALVDSQKRFCLQILTLMCQYVLFSMPDSLPFVVLQMMKITILSGTSEFASTAIVSYGMLCIAAYGDVEMGYRFGRLGLAVLDRNGPSEFLPRVHGTFYGNIFVYKRPLAEALQPIAKAYRIGVHTGDLQGAFLCANIFCIQSLEAGVRLSEVEPELDSIQQRLKATSQQSMSRSFLPLSRIVNDFIGRPTDVADWDELRLAAEESGVHLDTISVIYCQLALAWVHDDFNHVETMMYCIRHFSTVPPGASRVGLLGLIGAYAMGLARKERRKNPNVTIARKMIKQLRFYASFEPSNAQPRLHLVQAELASYQGNSARAQQKYMTAVALSAATHCLLICAKANECFARHLHRTSDDDAERNQDSLHYFSEACRLYKDWGGMVKYRSLSSEIEALFPCCSWKPSARANKRPSLLLHESGAP